MRTHKKNLKSIFYRLSQLSIAVVFIITFLLSYFYFPKDSYWYLLFLGICSEMLVLLFATFFIERSIEAYKLDIEEKKWLHAKEYAHKDIQNLTKSLAITIFIAAKIDLKEAISANNDSSDINELLVKMRSDGLNQILEEKLLPQAQKFSVALNRDKSDLESTIMLYKDIVPPYLLHSLWLVRSQLDRFSSTLEEGFSSLLEVGQVGELKDTDNKELYSMIIASCETALNYYLIRLEELLKKLNQE